MTISRPRVIECLVDIQRAEKAALYAQLGAPKTVIASKLGVSKLTVSTMLRNRDEAIKALATMDAIAGRRSDDNWPYR